jgi:hypothetical protein
LSIPKNHHYVSRCLIDKFINRDNSFFCYDKQKKTHFIAKSSKSVFSEYELNSIIDDDGQINHKEVEDILNINFETDFQIHYEKINKLLQDNDGAYLSKISQNGELEESLFYLSRHGVIGIFRNPTEILSTNNAIDILFTTIYESATEELKQEISALKNHYAPVKNKYNQNYKKLCDGIIENMGECVFSIFIAPKNAYFILPDCNSFHDRANLIDDIVYNGKILSSPTRSVCRVGYPINSKVLIMIESKKISTHKTNRLLTLNTSIVSTFNKILYDSAKSKIICEDEAYLKSFIKSISE